MPVDENQFIEIEEIVEVDSTFEDDHEEEDEDEDESDIEKVKKSLIKRILNDPEKRKRLSLALLGCFY